MIGFLVVALAFALALPALVHLLVSNQWLESAPSFLYVTTWTVALLMSVLFIYLYRSAGKGNFAQFYLLSIAVKIFVFLAYNVVVALEDRGDAAANLLYFLVVYFVFTAIEVAFLYGRISRRTGS